MAKKPPVLGIDFGTTNTKAAWLDHAGSLHLVPVTDNRHTLPSAIWYPKRSQFVVGASALGMLIENPTQTVYAPKRFIGRSFRSHFVSNNKDKFSYEIVADKNGKAAVKLHGEVVSFTEIASNIIMRIVELAQASAGHDFDECVLTVPAHFGYAQRRAVRAAAEMGGMDVRAIINEPTAAALYYAKRRGVEQAVLIYDLGGGTFDISLVAIRGSLVMVLGTGGDPFLGGRDFDTQIAERLAERFERQHGYALRQDRQAMLRLTFAAERAKIALAKEQETLLHVPMIAYKNEQALDFSASLTRDALEMLTANLVERTLGASEELVRDVGIKPNELNGLVFVGGQTRMLSLQRRMAAAFHHDPGKNINPEMGVAVGAAILARSLDMPGGAELVDVISMPIGVMLPGHGAREVIPSNTGVPCLRTTDIDTRPAPGADLAIGLWEAQNAQSLDREFLGRVKIPASWLAAHSGHLKLELRAGQDFAISVAARAADRAILELPIDAPMP